MAGDDAMDDVQPVQQGVSRSLQPPRSEDSRVEERGGGVEEPDEKFHLLQMFKKRA